MMVIAELELPFKLGHDLRWKHTSQENLRPVLHLIINPFYTDGAEKCFLRNNGLMGF